MQICVISDHDPLSSYLARLCLTLTQPLFRRIYHHFSKAAEEEEEQVSAGAGWFLCNHLWLPLARPQQPRWFHTTFAFVRFNTPLGLKKKKEEVGVIAF